METSDKLKKWLQKMGYEGKIPSNLKPICNGSTAFVWEQLINNVKPRQEIEHKRNNILINRLLQNKEDCNASPLTMFRKELEQPLKEMEAWKKRRELQGQINVLQDRIRHTENKVNHLTTSNKSKYLQLENLHQKIRKNKRQTFLLNSKSTQIQSETDHVQDMLNLARNLTPNEHEEHDKTEVLATLEKCARKLEKIVDEPKNHVAEVKNHSLMATRSFFSSTRLTERTSLGKSDSNDSLGLLDLSAFDGGNVSNATSPFKDTNSLAVYDLALLNDDELNNGIKSLEKRNRGNVWDALDELNQKSKSKLVRTIVRSETTNERRVDLHDCETKLYATHVDYELKARMLGFVVRNLQRQLDDLQKRTIDALERKTATVQQVEYVKSRQEEHGLNAALEFSQKFVSDSNPGTENEHELKRTTENLRIVETNIARGLRSVRRKLDGFKRMQEIMSQTRNESLILNRKLELFTHDPDWLLPLDWKVTADQISALTKFPLDYNRKIDSTFVRDLPLNYVPHREDFDSNAVYMLATTLQNPSGHAWALLVDLLRQIERSEMLAAGSVLSFENRKRIGLITTVNEWQTEMTKLGQILDKLRSMVTRAKNRTGAAISSQIHETIELWLQMPVDGSISDKRLVNGVPYQYYRKIFDIYYKQLP